MVFPPAPVFEENMQIDPRVLARALQPWIDFGSRKNPITLNDISVYGPSAKITSGTITMKELRTAGTKLFDAMLYLSCSNKSAIVSKGEKRNNTDEAQYSKTDTALALLYCYLYVLNKVEFPDDMKTQGPYCLREFLKARESPRHYANMLADFDLNRLDKAWIKHLNLPQAEIKKMVHGFSIRIAGHRYLEIFKTVAPQGNMTSDTKDKVEALRKFASTGPHWSVHPATRDFEYTRLFGSPNKFMHALVLKAYTKEQVKSFQKRNMIPIRDEPYYMDGLTFTYEDLKKFESPIFGP